MAGNSRRQYPDISFVNTDTKALAESLIKAYELFTDRTLAAADPARLFILWLADIVVQERVIIDESAKQNVPRYAQGEYLDSIAEIFKDTQRLQPAHAVTTFRFYLSAVQPSAQTIPKGTRISVDGEITFETTASVTIMPGALYGEAPAMCLTAGTIGNGFEPGKIKQIVDLYKYYDRVENITTSEGGADTETDEAFYERLRESMEAFSTAGSIGAYGYWVKTASQMIADVKPTTPEPGVVDIRVLLEGGKYPDTEMVQLIYDTLYKDGGKIPLTDYVMIAPPDTRPFHVDITYFLPIQREESTETARQNAESAVAAYVQWQTEKMGRDINPDELRYLLKKAGVKRVEVTAPKFEIVEDNEVAAIVGIPNIVFGGIEDE